MSNITDRLDKMKDKILEDSFIEGKGLGNEINFYIFDYEPKYELIVRDHINWLVKDLRGYRYNRRILVIDLYELLIESTKEKNVFNHILEMEENVSSEHLLKAITTFGKPEIFLDKINSRISDNNVIFITGIGKVYPFARSHSILNNLQELPLGNIPVVLFFPGSYTEQDLSLFNRLKPDNYYRAFRLLD